MTGRFCFYRRQRILPFLAAFCLVFVNGATLTPLVVPAEVFEALAASLANNPSPDRLGDTSRWLQFERRNAEQQEPAIAAALPPLVKNLRRPSPTHTKSSGLGSHERPTESSECSHRLAQQTAVGNAVCLRRLCRFLL